MNNLFIEWIHAYGLAFFIFLIISSFINSNFLFEFLCTLYYSSSKSFIKNTKYVNEFVVIARFRCLACKKSNIILLFINHAFPTIFIISLLHMLQLLVWDTTIRFNGNKKIYIIITKIVIIFCIFRHFCRRRMEKKLIRPRTLVFYFHKWYIWGILNCSLSFIYIMSWDMFQFFFSKIMRHPHSVQLQWKVLS